MKVAIGAILIIAVAAVAALRSYPRTSEANGVVTTQDVAAVAEQPVMDVPQPAPAERTSVIPSQSHAQEPEAIAGDGQQATPLVPLTPLESRLHNIATTFTTEDPDLLSLLDIAATLAEVTDLVPGTLVVGETISGKLQLGAQFSGSFRIDGDKYSIQLLGLDAQSECRRQLTINFRMEDGEARKGEIALQSLPNKINGAPNLGGTEVVGWRASVDPKDGAYLHQTTTKVMDSRGQYYLFEVSDHGSAPIEVPFASDTAAFASWSTRLRDLRE